MPRKKKPPLTFTQRMAKIAAARLSAPRPDTPPPEADDELLPLAQRVKKILGITDKVRKTPNEMIFFVMYDIENNKVRRLVSKYLERKGCTRIQKSIFLADASIETYNQIKDDLAAVQAAYENHDSLIVLPVTTDYLRQMKIIGKDIAIDVITRSRNVLFF